MTGVPLWRIKENLDRGGVYADDWPKYEALLRIAVTGAKRWRDRAAFRRAPTW